MSHQPPKHYAPSRTTDTLSGVGDYLRVDVDRMAMFRDSRTVFARLCALHGLDVNTTWDALTIIEQRARQGIDPMDGRPGYLIKKEREEVTP